MKKIFVFALMAIMLVSAVMAESSENKCDTNWFCNQGLTLECQDFYDNSNYYTIAKWSYDGKEYVLEEQNNLYRYYNIDVTGALLNANWISDPRIESVLVKLGDERIEFDGGVEGTVKTDDKEISHITFCGYKSGRSSSISLATTGSGVPEFPGLAVGAAVAVATLGLVFLRKN